MTDPNHSEFDSSFREFLGELETDPIANNHPLIIDAEEIDRTDQAYIDVFDQRCQRLGIDVPVLKQDMADQLAAQNPDDPEVLIYWRVSSDMNSLVRFHPLIQHGAADRAEDDTKDSERHDVTVREDLQASFKLDEAFELLKTYGETVSLPLRRLLDDLSPTEPQAAGITSNDLFDSSEGKSFLERDRYKNALTQLAIQNPKIQAMLREQGMGERDSTIFEAGIIGKIALARITGRIHAETRPGEINMLLGTFPDREAQLAQTVENTSYLLLDKMPDYALPEDKWAPIILDPTYRPEN